MPTHRPTTRLLLPIMLLIAAFARPVLAQVEPIDPIWMVATRDAPLRCGELTSFYKVADLKQGQVVRVDGRSSRWIRVIYPEGLYGFVKQEHALDVDGDTLTIGDISDIKAPNPISGLTGSWRSIYLGKLEPNTRLAILGEALSKDGQMVGYRVRPPIPPAVDHPPQGFVPAAMLRAATQAEIDAHLASLESSKASGDGSADEEQSTERAGSDAEESAGNEPASSDAANGVNEQAEESEPGDSDNDGSGTTPASDDGAADDEETSESSGGVDPADAEAVDSLTDEMSIPTEEDLQAASGESSDDAAAAAESDVTPASEEDPADALTREQQDAQRWQQLEETLLRVRKAGGKTLEDSLDELVAEYERAMGETETATIRDAMASRLSWLQLRRSVRDQRLELQAALNDAKDTNSRIRTEREAWRSSRGFDIVGRLVPSAIYDGKTLPKMYRIVAAGEGGLTRTIGYVRDEPNLDLAALVGEVVGVSGDARLDTALRLRVITPDRISRFRPTDENASPRSGSTTEPVLAPQP